MHRFAVSAVLIGESKIVAADPIIFSAARIDSFDDGFAVVAFSHARRAPAFNFVFWDRGNIHIEKCFGGMPRSAMRSTKVAVNSAAARKSKSLNVTRETAIAGIPSSAPSMAAETVPE